MDDGDALRLAVKLGIGFTFDFGMLQIQDSDIDADVSNPDDALVATRRAIVIAAANIGKGSE